MSIFSRKSQSDREFELHAEVCRLTDRVASLERIVGTTSTPRMSFIIGPNGILYPEPTVQDRISAITNHIGIEIVSNPESHAKWVAQKMGAKK